MPRAVVLAVSAALMTLLSACGGAAGTGGTTTPGGPVVYDDAARVTAVGTLIGQDLDPYKAGGQVEGIIDVYDTLIRPANDLSLQPGLATEWAWSPDNLKLTLTLRSGVTFSDGTPFDSAAVVASLNRARSGETSTQKASLASISDVAAEGATKVVITVKQPSPALLSVLASPAGMVINPKLVGDDNAIRTGAGGLGTGPYTVERFQPTTQIVLTKRADYWDAASIPHAPRTFTYLYGQDGNARLNGLKSGQYQAVQATGTPGLNGPGALSTTNKQFTTIRTPSFPMMSIVFAYTAPFDNPLVRQAVAHAINFDALSPVLTDQMNCTSRRPVQLPQQGQVGFDPDAKPLAYDVDRAKQLLAQAGFPDGKGLPPITVTSSTASNDIVAAQAFQAELAKIGMQLSINSQPSRVFQVAQLTSGKAQMATLNATNGAGIDPSLGYNTGVLATPQYVDDSPAGRQYKDLISQAGVNPDSGARTKLYQQAESLATQNAFYIPFCQLNNGYATTAKLGGFNDNFWMKYIGALKVSALTVAK
ncbi:ABC transporter substrate-binding protein [Pseudonocardia sp. CA-107938]|uniref:ABC transporter substrate-binding protein n=1 Tax=Pseudonocardia sp. CA-107938 TaxID=3240021 RepID=UPI003D8A15A0